MIADCLTSISSRMPAHAISARRWYALPLLALGAGGFAAAWTLLALLLERQCAWLSLLAAADMVLLLKLSGLAGGKRRAGWAVATTACVIGTANFLITAGEVGKSFGLRPWESALQLGPGYAWLLTRLANSDFDLLLYAASLLLAAWLGLSARRPAPSAR